MKIKHVWHRKEGSQITHAFVPRVARKGQLCRAACAATWESWPIEAPRDDGTRCKRCVTALANREAKLSKEAP